jgi:isopenicillin N synthase-like dioxygenase
MEQVPTVDLRDPSATSLAELDRACREHGFFLVIGHGVDDLIERTWEQTRRFFAADPEVRRRIIRSEENPLGYFDRELTKRRRDHKEVFDFIDPELPAEFQRNRWPSGLDGFEDAMTEFFAAMAGLAVDAAHLVHRALGLVEGSRAAFSGTRSTSTVRLNHYPVGDPVTESERGGLADLGDHALGDHTDPGVLTLLLQDETGGLQAATRAGEWIDVPPRPGTIVVNLGDVMQVWTNDRYRAAIHRVVPMTERSRFSIPFFSNPAHDAVVAPVDQLAGGTPRYRPFPWRELMKGRADDNYRDLGTEDIQISRFRR